MKNKYADYDDLDQRINNLKDLKFEIGRDYEPTDFFLKFANKMMTAALTNIKRL